ncbi:uncharacterized protein EMH_0034880 [Eimeria mitis]|uniref:Uncharacterized protein n=1 Tax=Eimeria mitis TaxID=44415 RepID=U6JSK5_9EIME|nr:uncharacterized protein EMH_0034880 [Eimeria mitis]CDJ27796.1 hypothetical protein EMH_0034880 [Eimeria mitis]
MSSIYKAVATVCFVALWGLHTTSAEDPYLYEVITEDVSEEAYLAANLVRNGKLPVHIGNVVKDESLVTTLKRADQGAPAFIEGPCNEVTVKAGGLEMFHHIFDYHANPDYQAYLAANLVRNGKLPVHIGNVVKDESLVTTLKRADQGAPAFIEGPCNEVTVKAGGLEMFHHIFDYHANPDYRQLLQAALDAGLVSLFAADNSRTFVFA